MVGILLCGLNITVFASEQDPWSGLVSELIDGTEAEDIWENIQKGTYLQRGVSKITNKGNRTVELAGNTDAYQKCDQIFVTVYLDRYENGKWIEVSSVSYQAKDAYTVSGSALKVVTPGYYYRARGYHTIYKGSTVESAASLTDGIWIN